MTDLSYSLSHIVANLSSLISQIGSTTSKTQTNKYRKSSHMSYHQYLSGLLAGIDLYAIDPRKGAYNIREDLYILNELASVNNVSIKTFQSIWLKRRIAKTPEQMLKRYSETLHQVDQKDLKKIVNWIQQNGLSGYLSYSGDGIYISRNEPTSFRKRQRPRSLDRQGKKQQKKQKIPTNCKQLHQTLNNYSKIVGIPLKTLLAKLDQVSGDLLKLDQYIQTKDARLLWTSSEDQILRSKKSGPQLEILKKYRGSDVQVRKKYLGV